MNAAYITHCSATRLRVRIPNKRYDADFFDLLRQEFANFSGVIGIETNPTTASVLLLIDGNKMAIQSLIEACPWLEFKVFSKKSKSPSLLEQASELTLEANQILRSATAGWVDVPSLLFTMLFALGVFQVSQGKILASASALLMSALSFLPIRERA